MTYIPDRGHIIWLNFQPHLGHEQSGRRPALVLSPKAYNSKTGMLLACPITSQVKGYPFEVVIPQGLPISGVILTDQVKSLDWHARKAAFLCALPAIGISEALGKLVSLLSSE